MIPSGNSFDFRLPTYPSPGQAELVNRSLNELFQKAKLSAAELEIRQGGTFSSDMPTLFCENLASLPGKLSDPRDRERGIKVLRTAISLFGDKDGNIQPLVAALEALEKSCKTEIDKEICDRTQDQTNLMDESAPEFKTGQTSQTGAPLDLIKGQEKRSGQEKITKPIPRCSAWTELQTLLADIAEIPCLELTAMPPSFINCMKRIDALPPLDQVRAFSALVAQLHRLPDDAVPAAFVACVTQIDHLPLNDHKTALGALMDEIDLLPADLLPAAFEAFMAPIREVPAEEQPEVLKMCFTIIPDLPARALQAAFGVCVKHIRLLAPDRQDEALFALTAEIAYLVPEWHDAAMELLQTAWHKQ
jgi:hypothetical protein